MGLFSWKSSFICATFQNVWVADGHPEHEASSTHVTLLSKYENQYNIEAMLIVSSAKRTF
jgi:hypothetical protein